MISDDFKPKFICKYDRTFWYHLLREFILSFAFSFISTHAGIFFPLGVNIAWEYQDGLRNDGFNVIDFVGGLIGIILGTLGGLYAT